MSRHHSVENTRAELPQASIGEHVGGLPWIIFWGSFVANKINSKESCMFGKKHIPAHNFNPLAKKPKSHKKRNALIGLAGAVTTVVISGAISKGRDSK